MKTVLQVWPKQPPPEYRAPVPLTDSERIDRLEYLMWSGELPVRVQNWMDARSARMTDQPRQGLPLCERKR